MKKPCPLSCDIWQHDLSFRLMMLMFMGISGGVPTDMICLMQNVTPLPQQTKWSHQMIRFRMQEHMQAMGSMMGRKTACKG